MSSQQFGEAARRILLTKRGRQYIEENFTLKEVQRVSEDARSWWVYYDTKQLALARQLSWLREQDDKWELWVCSSAQPGGLLSDLGTDGSRLRQAAGAGVSKSRTVSSTQDILKCLGINGQASEVPLRRILAEVGGLRPFARMRTELQSFVAKLPAAGGREVKIELNCIHFDTKYAEPATISVLLEQYGREVRQKVLQVSSADFRAEFPKMGSTSMATDVEQVEQFLRKHSLDYRGGGSDANSSFILAYLRACRPAHLRSLQEAGIQWELQETKDGFVSTISPDDSEEDDEVYHI